ncbi:unnamed protein product [Chrysodeixis includens]|uniref:Uncharacterized protein n=1 Tax=Chrysodeixis includens TaxID=689277 RepID=A0A9N8L1I7_CHRIL|nr:unnamed protein product [Chrysodeixis includens]
MHSNFKPKRKSFHLVSDKAYQLFFQIIEQSVKAIEQSVKAFSHTFRQSVGAFSQILRQSVGAFSQILSQSVGAFSHSVISSFHTLQSICWFRLYTQSF